MARKPKNDLDLLIRLASALPWKVSICLVPVSYVLLHHWATAAPVSSIENVAQIGNLVASQVITTFAVFAQYAVPLILVTGGIVNYCVTRKRKSNYENTVANGQRSALLNLSWREFEELVAEHFKRQGYDVKVIGGDGPDGGVDVELRKGGELSLVQCKQWRATKVGVDVVRELYGVMAARGATSGYVVTAATFTKDAQEFVDGRNIRLLTGEQLISQMRPQDTSAKVVTPAPACPKCSTTMVSKVARQGDNSGRSFWACPRFPECRGARSM